MVEADARGDGAVSTTAYPLCWPTAWPKTPNHKRQRARFYQLKTRYVTYGDGSSHARKDRAEASVKTARDDVFAELRRLGARSVVISSNVELRLDGLPYSNRREPEETGVAVYFIRDGRQQCIPCDKWDRVADNLTAIARTIEALRGIERWGAKSMVDAAFSGFKALPENAGGTPWWEILGVQSDATVEEIRSAWRSKAKQTHPDTEGGSDMAFHAAQTALRMGLQARGETA